MKATGIVRRVDDLGRIVIPKEIRRTLRIREGDPSYTTFTSEEQFIRAITNIYIWCRDRGLCQYKGEQFFALLSLCPAFAPLLILLYKYGNL
jgi:hypothetical protein